MLYSLPLSSNCKKAHCLNEKTREAGGAESDALQEHGGGAAPTVIRYLSVCLNREIRPFSVNLTDLPEILINSHVDQKSSKQLATVRVTPIW